MTAQESSSATTATGNIHHSTTSLETRVLLIEVTWKSAGIADDGHDAIL